MDEYRRFPFGYLGASQHAHRGLRRNVCGRLDRKHILKRPISVKAEIAILLCFLFFACFQAWQDTYTSIRGLQAQINGKTQQQPLIQVSPPVVTVVPAPSPPAHTHLTYIPPELTANEPIPPFKAGQKIAINLGFYNSGDYDAHNAADGVLLRVLPVAKVENAFRRYGKEIRLLPGIASLPPLRVHRLDALYHTFLTPPLSAEDAYAVNIGKSGVVALQKMQWSDDTGVYELILARYYLAEPDGTFNWHALAEDGQERKLRPN